MEQGGQSPFETSAALLIVLFVLLVLLSGRDMKTMVGALALFGMAIVRLVPSATRITNGLHTMRFYAHAVSSVGDGLRVAKSSEQTQAMGAPIEFESAIRLDNLGFRYPQDTTDS